MEITKAKARTIFNKVDKNRDNSVSENERKVAKSKLSKTEWKFLNKQNSLQKANQDNQYDKKSDMRFWEYLQAVSQSSKREVFSKQEILWANRDYVLAKVKKNGEDLRNADDRLKGDREIVFEAVKQYGLALQYAKTQDLEIILTAVKKYGMALKYAKTQNMEIVLTAVKKHGMALGHVNDRFRRERNVAMEAVKQNGLALKYVNPQDLELVLTAVRENGLALEHVCDRFRGDRDVAMEAVKQNGLALKHVKSQNLELVLIAVKKNGMALKYADPSLEYNKNENIVFLAVRKNDRALYYADPSLRRNSKFVLSLIGHSPGALPYADITLKHNPKFVLDAIKENYNAFDYSNSHLFKNNKEFILKALVEDGMILQHIKKPSEKMILTGLRQNGLALKYIRKQTSEMVLTAVRQNGLALQHVPMEDLKREYVLAAVRQNGMALRHSIYKFENDEEIALSAVKNSAFVLELGHVGEKLLSSHNFQRKLLALNFNCYPFLENYPNSVINKHNSLMSKLKRRAKSFVSKSYYYMSGPISAAQLKYNKISSDLNRLGIGNHYRFNDVAAKEIVWNRENIDKPDSRPVALVVYPNKDGNNAFINNSHILDLIDNGYRVVYFEAKTDNDFYAAVVKTGKHKKISLLVVGGHGTKKVTAFGKGDPSKVAFLAKNEKFYLDRSDKKEMHNLKLSLYMEAESLVILESCSTGSGGADDSNIANLLSSVFTSSKVFSPEDPTEVDGYKYNQYGRVFGVDFSVGSDNTYVISSKLR